jgi:hypothetical protein
MIRLPARFAAYSLAGAAALLACAAPLAAQQTFELPPATPSPSATPTPAPAPAGPADERAGVAIPPRALPTTTPSESAAPAPTATPVIQPLPAPTARQTPQVRQPAPTATPAPGPTPLSAPTAEEAVAAATSQTPAPPLANAPALPEAPAGEPTTALPPLPAWWPYAAGALAALLLLGGGAFLWRRRRKPAPLRLAAPVAGASGEPAGEPAGAGETPRVDLTLDIMAATRSVMMFTLHYRLTIANRSGRAVNDCNAAAKLVCARGNAGAAAGAAQALESIARIGPHQARSLTGTLQLPISAISPLRQGQTPLFIPLVHVTLEGEGLPADTKTFVIGTPSPSGRIHPIPLDQPPGGIAGLVAQAVVVPAASAA